MIKRYLFVFALALFFSSTYAAQVFIDPQFSDARFQPADKLHAGCMHNTDVSIKTASKQKVSSFRFVISYEPQNIEILDIKPADAYKGLVDSKIEYDKVIVSLLNKPLPEGSITKLFTISFKSNEYAKESLIAIRKPSYVLDQTNKEELVFVEQKLNFEAVPECEPDIVPPTINLIKPQNTNQILNLDSYFVFELKDQGKGIDPDSVIIKFDGITYSGTNSSLVWSKDKSQIAFYPSKWLPIGKTLDLNFSVSDKQSYGGPNTSKKTFSFVTKNGIAFENSITPDMYRNLISKAQTIYATDIECDTITFLASNIGVTNFDFGPVESLSKKIHCSFNKDLLEQATEQKKESVKSTLFISVFSILGWILFAITFILKLHYIASYRKQKKLVRALKFSISKH